MFVMKTSYQIVEGGGWVPRQRIVRPRARFFGFLSVLWLGVSVGAFVPFLNGWPESFGFLEWLCGTLLVLQFVFVMLAVAFGMHDQPRGTIEQHRSPRQDRATLD